MAIRLITDSTSYIPPEITQENNIEILPLVVNFEDESFLDLPEYFSDFYTKLKQVNYIPKSSQPSTAIMLETLEEAVKAGDDVIAVFLSSKMSGTYNTACMLKKQLLESYSNANIHIIDSTSNCMQMGHVVLAGVRAIKSGKSFDEVCRVMEETIPKTRFIFSPATLEYLKRGGRIGSAQAFLGQILQVKPILTVKDGMTTSLDKVRTRKKAIQYIADTFLNDVAESGLEHVVIHHIEDMKEALKLKDLIEKQLEINHIEMSDIKIMDIGPVIGTHVGPGAIGIAYETKDNINN